MSRAAARSFFACKSFGFNVADRAKSIAVAALVTGAAISLQAPAMAQTGYYPAAKIGTAALITPSAANGYYGSGTTSSHFTGWTEPYEIVELARALKNDPDLIYDFVRNNIEITWSFGVQKGALGALVDRYGTAFDQAQLMVELLRQANYTASYQFGTITLTGAQFATWSGVSSAAAACQLLASGGIPALINGGSVSVTDCTTFGATSVSSVQLSHIWVSVSINGTSYVFDPAYKGHTFPTPANLVAAAGLTSGQSLAQTSPGLDSGTASGVSYIHNLNSENLKSQLLSYSNNLLSYIQANNLSSAKLDDVIGIPTLIRDDPAGGHLRQTNLPYTATATTSWAATSGIPNQYRTTLQVQAWKCGLASTVQNYFYEVLFNNLLYVDDIYGRKLIIDTDFDKSHQTTGQSHFGAYLKVVDETGAGPTIASANTGDTVDYYDGMLTLTVNHPYAAAAADGSATVNGAYMDAVITKPVTILTPLLILHAWGDSGRGLVDKWSSRDDKAAPTVRPNPSCETCDVTSHGTVGDGRRELLASSWITQSARAARINAALAKSVYTLHHAVGVVAGDAQIHTVNYQLSGVPIYYSIADNFDRIDVDSAFSLTSTTANASDRRAGVHVIAATSEALEGSVAAQNQDLPDTTSTATRFEWGNRPPTDEDPSGGVGPRRFYQFDPGNATEVAQIVPTLGKVEGTTATNGNELSQAANINIGGFEEAGRKASLSTAVGTYSAANFTVVASEEAFLGPGQRAGEWIPGTSAQGSTAGSHRPSKQRGGALVATRYSAAGEPLEIAHVAIGYDPYKPVSATLSKGGGGGPQAAHFDQYDPSESADLIKSHFVDKSNALGVSLQNGQPTYTAATFKVGDGDFPYSLSASYIWRGPSFTRSSGYGVSSVQPQSPWTTNWHNSLSMSGSGLEAMGDTDIRAATGTLAAFLAAQDIYKSTQSLQRDVSAVLVEAWWVGQINHNAVSATVGTTSHQFLKLINGQSPSQWIMPGAGPYTTLTQTGSDPTKYSYVCETPPPYAMTRGWNYSGLSFAVKNAQGDVQNFNYWENYTGSDGCVWVHGFRLNSWVFPQNVTVNLLYGPGSNTSPSGGAYLGKTDVITEVNNSLGRRITFASGGLGDTLGNGGFSNGQTGGNLRSMVWTGDSVVEPAGEMTYFAYTNGLLSQIFTPDNTGTVPSIQYDYDSLRRVKQVSNATTTQQGIVLGAPYQFLIADGVRGERIDPLGNHYAVMYDLNRHPMRYIDENGQTTSAKFDFPGRVLQYSYPEGDQETFSYDGHNNQNGLIKVAKPGSGLANISIQATFDQSCNKIATLTDARSNQTSWYFKGTTCLVDHVVQPSVTDARTGSAANPTTAYTYDGIGHMLTAKDPTGVVVQNTYDNTSGSVTYGYLLSTTLDPGAAPHANQSYTFGMYSTDGDPGTITDGRGKTFTYIYDTDRRAQTISGPASTCIKTENTYTGDLLTKTRIATKCNPNEGTDADWQVRNTAYSPTRKPQVVTDASGYETISGFDADDRVSDVTQCLTASSSFSLTCPGNQRITHTTFEPDGQTYQVFKAWNTAEVVTYATYAYTQNGKVDYVLDANSNKTDSTYDGFDRLSKLTFADSSYEQYGYDANGNMLSKRNRDGLSITWNATDYDALNRELNRHIPANAAGNFARTLSTSYDLASRKWDVTADGQTLQHRYDTAGRLTSVNDTLLAALGSNIGLVSYAYDAAGNRSSEQVYTAGTSWGPTYNYDDAERLYSVISGGSSIASYILDPLSHRTSATLLDNTTVGYLYWPNGDLRTLTDSWNGGGLTTNLTTNGAHQITGETLSNTSWEIKGAGATQAYTPNNLNQYSNVAGTTYNYDGNGNLKSDGTFTYAYDEENRLRSATATGHTISYDYDPLGRRRAKTVDGLKTYFISNSDGNEIAELSSTGARQRLYVYGGGVDDRIAMYSDGTTGWDIYHTDHHGSTIGMTRYSASGQLVGAGYHYGPYGESADDRTGNPFRYTGRYLDAETGLYYYRARYYSPTLGRFLQTDPIGSKADLDLYAYTYNDPLNNTDPSGNCPMCVIEGVLLLSEALEATGVIEGVVDTAIAARTAFVGAAAVKTAANVAEAASGARGGVEAVTKGEEGAKAASSFLQGQGMKEVGKEVTVRTEKGATKVDRVMQEGEKNVGLEAKNGPTAKLNSNQKVQHGEINSGGSNVMSGGNAERAGLEGQSVDHVVTVHVENGEVTKAYCQLPACKSGN